MRRKIDQSQIKVVPSGVCLTLCKGFLASSPVVQVSLELPLLSPRVGWGQLTAGHTPRACVSSVWTMYLGEFRNQLGASQWLLELSPKTAVGIACPRFLERPRLQMEYRTAYACLNLFYCPPAHSAPFLKLALGTPWGGYTHMCCVRPMSTSSKPLGGQMQTIMHWDWGFENFL